jgi:mono/diheme cytochrome c family protein
MKTLISVLAALVAFSTAARADHAAELWAKHCASCHGKDGKGQTKMGRKTGARDYTDPKVQAAVSDEQAFKAIKEGLLDKSGKTLMKPNETLTDDDLKALVAYLRQFQK